MSAPDPWDRPETAAAWRAFVGAHDRYARVNEAIAAHADLSGSDLSVLDVGAGQGGTTEALLPHLGPGARVTCVEPSAAMREATPVKDPRVRWLDALPDDRHQRVVCGSSIWLLGPLEDALPTLRSRLAPGGALVFAIPAAYLGVADPPGDGTDPLLQGPALALVADRTSAPPARAPLPSPAELEERLAALGLRAERWDLTTRWTLTSYAAWLGLPPIAEVMHPGLPAAERSQRLRRAVTEGDPDSGRDERWLGWTARA